MVPLPPLPRRFPGPAGQASATARPGRGRDFAGAYIREAAARSTGGPARHGQGPRPAAAAGRPSAAPGPQASLDGLARLITDGNRDLLTAIQQLHEDLLRMTEAAQSRPRGRRRRDPAWGPDMRDFRRVSARRRSLQRLLPQLRGSRAWQQLSRLFARIGRLLRRLQSGTVSLPAAARRQWRALWARTCEVTSGAASWVAGRLPDQSPARDAARRLDHAAAEGAAHAHGWLPAGQRLPAGSYEPPAGYAGPAWARADAASRLAAAEGGGRLTDLSFPDDLAAADGTLRTAFAPVRPTARAGRAAAHGAARTRAAAGARPSAATL